MVRVRRLAPKGGDGGTVVVRVRKLSAREGAARRRELLKAGYSTRARDASGRIRSEITRLDNDYEAGLLSLPLKQLRKSNVLGGRRRHIKHIMKSERVSWREAQELAIRDFVEWGGILGRVDDYVQYYYSEFQY